MNIEEVVNDLIEFHVPDTGLISDSYHTFKELYDHRIELYLALCKRMPYEDVWMSRKNGDGNEVPGWFVVGIGYYKGEQITYHIPNSRWDECSKLFLVKERAPKFDGHTYDDVLSRLKIL